MRGMAELPLEGKADANSLTPQGPWALSSTCRPVELFSPVLSQSQPLEQALHAGGLHACLRFSPNIFRVTDFVFFLLVIYVQV